ncbi:LysE family translocator [Thermoactinospora rubra]|uniref:LysE family translocator n=1 Tax=Thermoactinospora rubra TaxID=1088767 RepID=UPI000A112646|nr:LysE family translocator [Thermoactinospora rubra]
MPDLGMLALFCAATLGLLLVPGPAVVYIVTRSVVQGRVAGLVSVAGIHLGSMVHVLAATLGLSAILAASATAFTIVKWAGVAYLLFLGVRALLRKEATEEVELTAHSRKRLFWEGFVVNVLNPKTAIFFLAFLPQFVDTASPVAPQILVLGAIFTVFGMTTDSAYALAASALAGKLRGSARARRRLDVGSGLVYLGLGAYLAASKN